MAIASTLVWRQTDTMSICAAQTSCSGLAATGQDKRKAIEGGTAGTITHTVSIPKDSTVAAFSWECAVPTAYYNWAAGDWKVEVHVKNTSSILELDSVYICRQNSSCVSQETIVSQTSIGQAWTSDVVYTYTFSGVRRLNPGVGDHVVVIVGVKNTSTLFGTFANCEFDREITSPFIQAKHIGPGLYGKDMSLAQ